MARRSSIFTCTAPGGTGKSLCRGPLFLLREFLPEGRGVWRGNIPIDVDALAAFYCKRNRKADAAAIADRVRPIPPEVCVEWMRDIKDGGSGPWETYAGVDMTGAHFCFDEGHLFLGKRHSTEHRNAWRKWLAEIRHVGATVEFVSQDLSSFSEDVEALAESRVILTNFDLEFDPVFRIRVGDWYELRAAFTREYRSSVRQDEQIKKAGKWTTTRTVWWPNEPQYWRLYDSYSKPQGHDGQVGDGAAAAAHEFQRRSVAGVCWWFVRRNLWELGTRAAVCAAALAFCLGGGAWLFRSLLSAATGVQALNAGQVTSAASAGESPAVKGPPGVVRSAESPRAAPAIEAEPTEQERRDAERLAELERWAARVSEPASALGAVLPDRAVFRDGSSYRPGEKIERGTNAGYSVESIDFDRRAVLVRSPDGVPDRLVLVRERVRPPEVAGSGSADLGGDVPGDQGGSGRFDDRRRVIRPTGDDLGGGYAVRGVRPDSGQ